MLFNSVAFALFFPAVYLVYLALRASHRAQNAWLVLASYFFYGFWDPRFVLLLVGTTAAQYLLAHAIARAAPGSRARARLVTLAVGASLAVLGAFKYFDFFASSLASALHALGLHVDVPTLHLVLPVGMSFYTFKEISYVVDVHRGKLQPTRDVLAFALYLSFFPQLVAGPIERASEMLPQLSAPRRIRASDVEAGLYLVLSGLMKKMVIADNLARIASPVFDGTAERVGLDVALGILAYTFQIYCDFSGYSDIARGIARLMGFHLPLNFRLPYFAADPSEFWQRWHISLSSWLRDYLYIPLGGNRSGRARTSVNLFVTMLLGGLWHGAAWNFVVWGAFHGALLGLYRLRPLARLGAAKGLSRGLAIAVMFTFTAIGWVFFRASTLSGALTVLGRVTLEHTEGTPFFALRILGLVLPLVLLEAWQERSKDLFVALRLPQFARVLLFAAAIHLLALFAVREATEFIYFQF